MVGHFDTSKKNFAPWILPCEIFAPWIEFRTQFCIVRNFRNLFRTVQKLVWAVRNATHVPRGCFAQCENFRTLDWGVRNFAFGISHLGMHFRMLDSTVRNFLLARCSFLVMTINFPFQLRFEHRLKRWVSNFPSFETVYSMYKMDSRKFSKNVSNSSKIFAP